jgi:hypothetical protein
MYPQLTPPSRTTLARRLANKSGYAAALVTVSLAVGMAGYHWLADLPWVDAFENAAMLLGGMGPVSPISRPEGKIFAGLFALYAGLLFLAITALVLSPVLRHALHVFHWEASRAGERH